MCAIHRVYFRYMRCFCFIGIEKMKIKNIQHVQYFPRAKCKLEFISDKKIQMNIQRQEGYQYRQLTNICTPLLVNYVSHLIKLYNTIYHNSIVFKLEKSTSKNYQYFQDLIKMKIIYKMIYYIVSILKNIYLLYHINAVISRFPLLT